MILVGSTGFVGSNLREIASFESVYHRTDIKNAYDSKPDILIYAGVTGTKFWANKKPDKDYEVIMQAKENICRIGAKKLILISSIDVNASLESDDSNCIKPNNSCWGAYGNHRLELEKWVMDHYFDYHIIRLPAIYGKNLKKNYIHDLISPIPPMLTQEKMSEVSKKIQYIYDAYLAKDDGMFHLKNEYDRMRNLREDFLCNPFNAISFTNPNSSFQYYNLVWLWNDIKRIIDQGIRVINLVTEPIFSYELYDEIYDRPYPIEYTDTVINYDIKTTYSDALNGSNGYVYNKEYVMLDLLSFIKKRMSISKNDVI